MAEYLNPWFEAWEKDYETQMEELNWDVKAYAKLNEEKRIKLDGSSYLHDKIQKSKTVGDYEQRQVEELDSYFEKAEKGCPKHYLNFYLPYVYNRGVYFFLKKDYEKVVSIAGRFLSFCEAKDFPSLLQKELRKDKKKLGNIYKNLLDYLAGGHEEIMSTPARLSGMLTLRAKSLEFLGKYESALKATEKVLISNVDDMALYHLLASRARLLFLLRRLESLTVMGDGLIETGTTKVGTLTIPVPEFCRSHLLQKVMSFIIQYSVEEKFFQEALQLLEDVYKDLVDTPEAVYRYYVLGGRSCVGLKEYEKALSYLQKGVEHSKKYADYMKEILSLGKYKSDILPEELIKEYINIKHLVLTEKCGFRLLYSGKTGAFHTKEEANAEREEILKVRGTEFVEFLLEKNPVKIYEGCLVFSKDTLYRVYEYDCCDKVFAESSDYGNATYVANKNDWFMSLTVDKQLAQGNEGVDRYYHSSSWKDSVSRYF